MRTFLDLDETGEDGTGSVGQRVVVEEVACGAGRKVILKCALVNLTGAARGIDREHHASCALAEKVAVTLSPDIRSPKIHLKRRGEGVLPDFGPVDVKGRRLVAPLLYARVGEPCKGAERQVVHRAGERTLITDGDKAINDGGGGSLAHDDQRVGEDGGVLPGNPMPDLDGTFHDDTVRHVKECSRPETGLVQCREFARTKTHLTGHEVTAEKIPMITRGQFERQQQDSGRKA